MDPLFLDGSPFDIRDRCLGPCLLAPFADELATRLARIDACSVLEIAADTARLTVALATRLPAALSITATDPDPDAVHAAAVKTTRARCQQADPAALPFTDASFDIITCQFGLATLPQRPQVLREIRRVMAPHGCFVFSAFAPLRANPAAECIDTELTRLFPADPPGFLRDGLHGYGDDERIDDDLTAAGFTDAMYANVDLTFTAPAHEAAAGYCLGTGLRQQITRHTGTDLEPTVLAVAAALRLRFGSDPIVTSMRALTVTASA